MKKPKQSNRLERIGRFLGKGEVVGSIPTGSTRQTIEIIYRIGPLLGFMDRSRPVQNAKIPAEYPRSRGKSAESVPRLFETILSEPAPVIGEPVEIPDGEIAG